jgi:hypothetical protein
MQHTAPPETKATRSRWTRATVLAPLLVCLSGLTVWSLSGASSSPKSRSVPAVETRNQSAASIAIPADSVIPVAVAPAATNNVPKPAAAPVPDNSAEPAPAKTKSGDAAHSRTILGEWQDEYRGKRHLTVRDDGTATMVVEPDALGKMLFADKLTFRIEWLIRDGRIVMKTVGGEPEGKTRLVTKIYGDRAEYQIRELTSDRMLLLDPDGKTEYDWGRPE